MPRRRLGGRVSDPYPYTAHSYGAELIATIENMHSYGAELIATIENTHNAVRLARNVIQPVVVPLLLLLAVEPI